MTPAFLQKGADRADEAVGRRVVDAVRAAGHLGVAAAGEERGRLARPAGTMRPDVSASVFVRMGQAPQAGDR